MLSRQGVLNGLSAPKGVLVSHPPGAAAASAAEAAATKGGSWQPTASASVSTTALRAATTPEESSGCFENKACVTRETIILKDDEGKGNITIHNLEMGDTVETECSRKPSLYIMFVLLGCTSLMCWNFFIQTLPFILLQKLNRRELNNLFLGLYQVANLAMQMVLMTLSKPRPLLVVFASIGSGIFGLMVAAAVTFIPIATMTDHNMELHLKDPSLRSTEPMNSMQQTLFGVLLLLSVLMGCCQGLIQGVGYTLSCQIPPGYVAAVAFGQGLAGLLVFSISTISCFFSLEVNTGPGLLQFCYMSFGIVAFMGFAFAIFFLYRIKHADIALSLARVSHVQQQQEECAPSEKRLDFPLSESRGASRGFQLWGRGAARQLKGAQREKRLWVRVVMSSWKELLLAVFHFSYTYHLYPSVGPLGWKYAWTFPNMIVVLYGTWFLFETIGRAAPDLGWVKGLGWLRPSRRAYAPLSLSTLVYLAPFLLGYLSKPGGFLTNPLWYMFVMSTFAFAHGWIGTLAFFYACNAVDDPRERMMAGPLTVFAVGFGCVLGFLTSLAY